MKLTKMKVTDVQRQHQAACVGAVKVLMRNLFFGSHKSDLSKITLNLPPHIKISELKLNQRAQTALADNPFFKAGGAWRHASLMVSNHGQSPSVGPSLFLALTLAAEAMHNKQPAEPRVNTLETELHNLVNDVVHSERNSAVFLRAHGWHGKGLEPLATIAHEHGLTHERVRQIVRSAEASLRKHNLRTGDLTCLRHAISHLAAHSPMKCEDGARSLKDQGVSGEIFDVQGVLDAAEFFGITTGMDRWVWEGSAFVRRIDPRDEEMSILMGVGLAQTLSQMHRDIRRHLRAEGALNIDEEAEKLKLKHGVSQANVRFAFQIYAAGRFCGANDAWFVTLAASDRIRKIHALVRWNGPQPMTALARACNASRLFSTNPPTNVLEALTNASGLFKNVDDKIQTIDAHAFDKHADVKIENAVMAALNEVGGKMPRHLLRHRLISEGEKGEEIAKQLRSSLLFKVNGKIVKLETIKDSADIDASFLASMGEGMDFGVFADNQMMGTTLEQIH